MSKELKHLIDICQGADDWAICATLCLHERELRQEAADEGLIINPHDGFMELTDKGRALFGL